MAQYILLRSFVGLSDYIYEVSCTGRALAMAEAQELGFCDRQSLKLANGDYTAEWYEVGPGDVIEVHIDGKDYGETSEVVIFTILPGGLENPPQKLEDERACNRLHDYLKTQCLYTITPLP